MNASEKDVAQDAQIQENAERIARNEEAIKRQTEALEKIRDHYYPPPEGLWKRAFGFVVKVVCVIVAYLGMAETLDWLWNMRESNALAEQYAEAAQRLFVGSGDAAGAMACYEKAIALDTGESEYVMALAFMKGMALAGELLGAERPLTDDEQAQVDASLAEATVMKELDPDDPMPRVLMAQAYLLSGEKEDAVKAITSAVARDPKRANVRTSACAILSQAGRVTEARAHLAEAERLNPSLPLIAALKGGLALQVDHDAASARKWFAETVRRSPRMPSGHVMLGRAILADAPGTNAVASVREARACFERALLLDAKSVLAMLGMAETYEREGNLLVARLWLDRALARDANCVRAYVARARVNGGLGDGKAAVSDLTSALAVVPFRADLYHLRADAQAKLGDAEAARADRATAAALADAK